MADWPADEPEPVPVVDQLTDCLARVLIELPEADASITRAYDLSGLTQADYASAHGPSLPAAKARLTAWCGLRGEPRVDGVSKT